jgi:hypothetical protein
MFEWKIQKAWESPEKDLGLGRILIFTSALNVLFFALFFLSFQTIVYGPLAVILLSLVAINCRDVMDSLNQRVQLAIIIFFVALVIIYNYSFVGLFDRMWGGLPRMDYYFSYIDHYLFGTSVSQWIYAALGSDSILTTLYYDFIQVSYLCFYLFPILGGLFYYKQLGRANKYKSGRYFASVTIFFIVNYLLYLLVPVTGPQYYLPFLSDLQLPMSSLGNSLNELVYNNHPTLIDCFPSGHAGVSILVTTWMFKIKNHYRYVFLIFCLGMINATLALKYHYVLDVVSSLPLAYFSYKLSYLVVPFAIVERKKRKWKF